MDACVCTIAGGRDARLLLDMEFSVCLALAYSADQFLACGKAGEVAHELASKVWLAVLDNLDESESTFRLLMRIAEEWEVSMLDDRLRVLECVLLNC